MINIESFLDIDINPMDEDVGFVASLTDKVSKYCDNLHTNIKDIWQQPNITIVRVNQ